MTGDDKNCEKANSRVANCDSAVSNSLMGHKKLRRTVLRSAGAAAGLFTVVKEGHTVQGQEGTTNLRTISYGETKEGGIDTSDPTGFRGHYEPVTFDGNRGDVITITMDAEGDPYLLLQDPNGNTVAENDDDFSFADTYDSRIQGHTLEADGEYTIIATSYRTDATFSYDLSLENTDSGNSNQNAQDLRSISYGETKEGEIDTSDPTGYYGHYEPVTFDGTAGDIITFTMTSDADPRLVLLDSGGNRVASNDDHPSLNDLNSRIQRHELQSSGEYTIVATSYDENATFLYELTLRRVSRNDPENAAGEFLSGTIVDIRDNPVQGARVETYFRAGEGDGSDQDTQVDSGAQFIAAATTNAEGTFVFDGSDDGIAIPRSEAEALREQFTSGYDSGVTIVAREGAPAEGDVWFGGVSLNDGAFFSSDFDVRLPLSSQRIFAGEVGNNGPPKYDVSVFREVNSNSPMRQTLNIEIRGSGQVELITEGNCAIQVPEDIQVRYGNITYGVYGTSLSEATYPFSLNALSDMGVFQTLPVYPVLRGRGFRKYTGQSAENEEIQEEAMRGIVGLVPGVGTLQGFLNTMSGILDFNENEDTVETIGGGSTLAPNQYDLVKGNWRTDGYAVNFRVPITLSGTGSREFAARAVFKTQQGALAGSKSGALDHEFEIPMGISESMLPGR